MAERLHAAWMTAPETVAVLDALTAEGSEVRFVGGSVRDVLLARPVSDVDLATPDPPTQVIALLDRASVRNIPTGLQHGTVTAVSGGRHFEITTLRIDVRTDGRHAEVAFTDDWEADAARRDFTMNAMSCTPDGRLFDYFGGQADLAAGRVRFVGDASRRIAEDYLRILRFFRFHAYYGRGEADETALAACTAAAQSIRSLSGERVREEMLKLLVAPDPLGALSLMTGAGVLAEVLPEREATDRFEALIEIERETGAEPLRRLAALITGTPPAESIARRWRLSNADAARLQALSATVPPIPPALSVTDQRRLLYGLGQCVFRDRVLLAWAARPDEAARYRAMLKTAAAWSPPALPVRGADVVALGIAAGPTVGRLLAAVEAWWIERDFAPDRAATLEQLRALVRNAGADQAQ